MRYILTSIEFGCGGPGISSDDEKSLVVLSRNELVDLIAFLDSGEDWGDEEFVIKHVGAAVPSNICSFINYSLCDVGVAEFEEAINAADEADFGKLVELPGNDGGMGGLFRFANEPTQEQKIEAGRETAELLAEYNGNDFEDGWV